MNPTFFPILDSRGNPTLRGVFHFNGTPLSVAVPSGASTGTHEAVELRDGGPEWNGKGVSRAVTNATRLSSEVSWDPADVHAADAHMCAADGTPNKAVLGANAILCVSMLQAVVQARQEGKELWEFLASLAGTTPALPLPFANVLNGGRHAGNGLRFQECMVVPTAASSFDEGVRQVAETVHALKRRITSTYGSQQTGVGDEGGFAPNVQHLHEALDLLMGAMHDAGHSLSIAIDAAASEFFQDGMYIIAEGESLTGAQLVDWYMEVLQRYPIISLEDPFDEDDFASFALLKQRITERGLSCQVVGDDLTVTNPVRIRQAIAAGSCDCLLLKVNQIGSVTEAIEAARIAREAGWNVMVSHRSGETEDTFIADVAVALGAQIKLGAPVRGERTAKYNRLLEIAAAGGLALKNKPL